MLADTTASMLFTYYYYWEAYTLKQQIPYRCAKVNLDFFSNIESGDLINSDGVWLCTGRGRWN